VGHPTRGKGACQALEDAVALGDSLVHEPDVVRALDLYERRRLPRANASVVMSHRATRGVQITNPLLIAVRDGLARLVPRTVVLRMLDGTLAAPKVEP
jgi:2-polyprenyl-6-methoxyphenol hydroxylase-like FAD-dependent oxidoreductase